jgi:predicted helicase
MPIQAYLSALTTRHKTGISREHSYRGDLQTLLGTLLKDVLVTNEPAHIACGAPDYILTRKGIPVGYVEAKDIGVNLASKALKEQFDRYRLALSNLIITDYLTFQFYKDGELTTSIAIAELQDGIIVPRPERFAKFAALIQNFSQQVTQSIKSPVHLAVMMAAKAKLMASVIEAALNSDDNTAQNSGLKAQVAAFKDILIHDISNSAFADVYAQTIAYGMFAARYHDTTLDSFSRIEAATLIPKSNPFLRNLFQYIAGYDLDSRLVWMVDELVQIFNATNVADIMRNFGKGTRQEDPVVHFYETFLGEYDPKLRKARGVWYTPEPVVDFIVRAVDSLIKTGFGLPSGLADTSKVKVTVDSGTSDKKGKPIQVEKELHRLQILDPAVGTGTFLVHVVRQLYDTCFASMPGAWPGYVKEHLIPRLNGFELLMTSYAMAHLKLDMFLTETGCTNNENNADRLKIYLTNSLEEHHPDTGTLFASWLSNEANEANHIKRDAPVMVVIGNPPYSVSSSNKSPWIQTLLEDYKQGLNERNIQPLSDDYIKFIRLGQHYIEKNGEGILAYISNNSFIDGIIHRKMRQSLLETFDQIYILDLHGNSKKKETAPDGGKDENVFDIMQGVSINLFIKTGANSVGANGIRPSAALYHHSLYGKREQKYATLNQATLDNLPWQQLQPKGPEWFFVPKDFGVEEEYKKFLSLNELFVSNSSGVKTHDDDNLISFGIFLENNQKYAYRPFDIRNINYDLKKVVRHRYAVMRHMLQENIGLLLPRQAITGQLGIFITTCLCDVNYTGQAGQYGAGLLFPLYLYPEKTELEPDQPDRIPNLNMTIVQKIAAGIGLVFVAKDTSNPSQPPLVRGGAENLPPDKGGMRGVAFFTPLDLLNYLYAVLHSPAYREKYKEFLKINFPRVPYPTDAAEFWRLADLGGQLRQIHLLETKPEKPCIFPATGTNIVNKPNYKDDRVYINADQYFENVPQSAWEFYIGGYQPAQKWLKDRNGRTLNYEDIAHYQKIIHALAETGRIMGAIDV